jgi:hypothetical protein
MPETYEVQMAEHKADKPDTGYGPKQVINLSLKNSAGEVKQAEWFTNASTSVPQPGTQLVGEISNTQYGLRFKKVASAASGNFGGSKEYKADPAKQAAIAMESSIKSAIDIVTLAAQHAGGYVLPDTVGGITEQVRMVAKALYAQIVEVSEATK